MKATVMTRKIGIFHPAMILIQLLRLQLWLMAGVLVVWTVEQVDLSAVQQQYECPTEAC